MSWWSNETGITTSRDNDNNNTVSVNGFSVAIQTNDLNTDLQKVNKNGSEYITVPHNTEYKLVLSNNRNYRCDAQVFIDGNSIGIWRIDAFDNITLERPANVSRKFTFMRERLQSVAQKGKDENGLIKVVFKPEKTPQMLNQVFYNSSNSLGMNATFGSNSTTRSMGIPKSKIMKEAHISLNDSFDADGPEFESGVTVLGDRSSQNFGHADKLNGIDTSNITTVHLRLVAQKDEYNAKYISISDSNKVHSNRVPVNVQRSSSGSGSGSGSGSSSGWFNWF